MPDNNVPVDPAQLPVEVPLAPPASVSTLIRLQGFEQLEPVFAAVAAWLRAFHLGGRTLTVAERDALDRSVAAMRRTIAQMSPE
jgi:hypothetical protein